MPAALNGLFAAQEVFKARDAAQPAGLPGRTRLIRPAMRG